MAISVPDMEDEFLDFFNEVSPYNWDYENPPITNTIMDKVGALWENVYKKGFLGVVPASTAVETAAQNLGDFLRNNPPTFPADGGAAFYGAVQTFFETIMNAMPGYTLNELPDLLVLSSPTSNKEVTSNTFAVTVSENGKTGSVMNIVTSEIVNLS